MQSNYCLPYGLEGFHRIHFTTWGNPNNSRILFCLHGLTRNARDFDYLAAALKDQYLVVCPDMAGRGQSDWFLHEKNYNHHQYLTDMATVLARFPGREVHWLGTSMGGVVGMVFAADPKTPITKLILNDVGPVAPDGALKTIGTSLANTPMLNNLDEFTEYLRKTYLGFGKLPDKYWQHLAKYDYRRTEDGRITRNFDPKILANFSNLSAEDCDFWDYWRHVRCPVLVLRGEHSNVLTQEIFDSMLKSGVKMDHRVIPGVGHTPALMEADQIDIVRNWLLG